MSAFIPCALIGINCKLVLAAQRVSLNPRYEDESMIKQCYLYARYISGFVVLLLGLVNASAVRSDDVPLAQFR